MNRFATLLAWLSIVAAPLAAVEGADASNRPADAALADSVTADAALRQARRLCELGQYRAAEAALRGLVGKTGATDQPHLVGALQLTARIDFESGRFEQALGAARRYEQFLAQLRDPNPEIVAQRQAALVLEAEAQLALGKRAEADQLIQQALDLPGGLHGADPLWEARLAMLRAQAAEARGDQGAAETLWRQVEARSRPVLERDPSSRRGLRQHLEAVRLVKEALSRTGRAAQAVALLERARQQLGPRLPAGADLLNDIADCHERLRDEPKTQQTLLEAMELVGHDEQGKTSAEYADLLDRLGASYRRQRELAQARDCWRRAAAIYEKLCSAPAEDDRRRAVRARLYEKLERLYQRLEDWKSGARVAERLLEYREQTLLPDDPAIWRSKTALGEFYAHEHLAAAARPLLNETLRYWRDRRPPVPLAIAGILNNLATLAVQEGSYAQAAALFEEAAPLYRKLFGAQSIERLEMEGHLAGVLAMQGRTRLAIDRYREAVADCRKAAASEPRADDLLAGLRLNLITLYRSQRQYGLAAALCEQAIGTSQQDQPGHDHVLLLFYLAAGSLRLAQFESPLTSTADRADLAAAENWAAKASALCERLALSDKPLGAKADMLAGAIAMQRSDLDAAERHFRRANQIAVAAKQPALEANCLTRLAEAQLLRAATNADARRAALAGSLDLARRAGAAVEQSAEYSSQQFMADFIAAKAQRALGQRQAATALLTRAVRRVESPQAAATGADSDRAEFFAHFVDAFDLLVDWNLTDGHAIEALTAAESGRNHAYLDFLPLASVDNRPVPAGAGEENLTHQQRETLAAYHRAVRRLREVTDQSGADEHIHAIVSEIAGLRANYAHIETAIRNASPYYRSLWGEASAAPDWPAIAANLFGPDNLLLYFHLGHAKSYLFVVSAGPPPNGQGPPRIETFELQMPASLAQRVGAKPGPLTRAAAARLLDLEWLAVSDLHASDTREGLTLAEQMALTESLLPKPARQAVARARAKYVYVIPAASARQSPLEALLLGAQPAKYIADVFPPLSYAPSATVLSLRRRQASAAERQSTSLLTVGVADYAESADRANSASSATPASATPASATPAGATPADTTLGAEYRALRGPLAPLPTTPEECERIGRTLEKAAPQAEVSLLLGGAATKANLRSALPGRRFVHLAARGLVDLQEGNLFGAIALATDPRAGSDDEFLALNEIPGLPLALCQLAAVNHCETRVDPADAGEPGFWLARAFMAAGAEDVVSSRWTVDDEAAAKFMEAFFENVSQDIGLNAPPRFAAALQAARDTVRRDPRWTAPHYWAPWMLVGPTR